MASSPGGRESGAASSGTTILTVNDIEKIGIEKTVEIALEVAWKGAKAVFLSFDIDAVDSGFVPGTGWPEPGGFLPVRCSSWSRVSPRKGSPGWRSLRCHHHMTSADITSLLGARLMVDTLAVMVKNSRIGGRLKV